MIEIEKLLEPISTQSPAGANLRLAAGDLTFSKLAELRRETDADIDAGGETRAADWKGVVRESSVALAERSKDLELAATLTQGLVGTEGFPGLVAGLRLVRQLIERYWDTLHPGFEDGEIVLPIRARPLAWLGGSREFLTTLKRVPIAGSGPAARSWLDYEQSRRVDEAQMRSDQQAYRELVDSGFISGEQWAAALGATLPGQLQAEAAALREALGELEALRKTCAARFGDEAPVMLELRNLLSDCADQLERALGGAGVGAGAGLGGGAAAAAAVGPAIGMVLPASAVSGLAAAGGLGGAPGLAPGAGLGGGLGVGTGGGPRGPIASREQAYQLLREVADYLRRAEPHSPVAPLIDRVVKWEKLSFPALFEDVVKNQDARAQLLELLGLTKPEES